MKNTQLEAIKELIKREGIELVDYLENYIDKDDEINDFYDLVNILSDKGAFDHEVVYYTSAMEYLAENDDSLIESMEYAHNLGFETRNINSELLASIHKSETNKDLFYGINHEIDEILS